MESDSNNELPNKVKYFREQVLALKKTELRLLILDSGNQSVSEKTIQTVERTQKGSKTTKVRILHGINKGLKDRGKDEISYEELYPED